MLRSGCTVALWLIVPVLVAATIPQTFGQAQGKALLKEPHFIVCPITHCGFAVQSEDTAELRMDFHLHMLAFHKQDIDVASIYAQMRDGNHVSKDTCNTIICPFGDSFDIWSNDTKEIGFLFGGHAQIIHDRVLSDSSVALLIKPNQVK